ncbi:ribbon-helix-helix protein, CopG family [Granulosicoccus sp. 3-233]|uniref:ribbon-helix-helix protein, CopG family n=1 Tax=Granulosicoccus sp. 3-233 TaxID=3417969 RepID=UPI003D339026
MSKDQPSKKNTSLRLESSMLKALKIRAIEEDSSVQVILERLVEEYLNTPRKQKKSKK